MSEKISLDSSDYKYLLQLKNNMQDAVKKYYGQDDAPLFITYQTGAQYTRGTTLEVGMAQLNASNENEDIVCAGPVYPMTDRGGISIVMVIVGMEKCWGKYIIKLVF